jgi:ATP-dependent exoDNAse (exonuclease V) beta subunit
LEKINTLFDKEEIRPLFYVSEGKVYNEKDIVNICGETKRIDRLIVKDKEVWVVDYKASRQNYAEHCQQLKNYLNITKALYPQSAVSGFLVYLDDLSLEKING